MKAEREGKIKKIENKINYRQYFLNVAVVFLFLFSSCSAVKNQTWTDEVIIDEKYEVFAEQVDSYLVKQNFQGAVLIGKGKSILFAKGYGSCDIKDKQSDFINPNTTFEAGSITKQITAAAIMQLEQKKKLSLDDKLSKFFPEYKHGDEITIRMLLNMRSGLTDHINSGDDFFPKNIYRHIEKNQLECKPLDDDIVLTYFYDAPLLTSPDSTYFYCNTNYYLLAKIIEMVSGKKYDEYIHKNILKPCGMNNSNFDFQKTDTKGYDYRNRYYSIPASLAFGCGDLNSSVVDLFKWNTNFTSGKVVKKKAFNRMIDSESYGFGVYRRENTFFHSGTTNVFNSYNLYDLNDKLSVIVLVNRPINQTNATFIAGNILKIYQN